MLSYLMLLLPLQLDRTKVLFVNLTTNEKEVHSILLTYVHIGLSEYPGDW